MFGYLLLLFQLFLGGHFHMSLSGHPSDENVGSLYYVRKDLIGSSAGEQIVPLPEWEWHFGKLVFQGNLNYFFHMSTHKKTDYYLRSGATMWKEGVSSLFILAVESAMSIYLVKTIYLESATGSTTVCPVFKELKLYTKVELCFSLFALMVCWISCVRGVTANKSIWGFFIFLGVADLVWNVWGLFQVWSAGANMCSLSAPEITTTAQVCVFVSMWCTFLILVACIKYCISAKYTRDKAKEIVSNNFEEAEKQFLGEYHSEYKDEEKKETTEIKKKNLSLMERVQTAKPAAAATKAQNVATPTRHGKKIK